MKKFMFLAALFLFCSPVVNNSYSQDWKVGIIVKGDLPNGTDIKAFQNQLKNAINANVDSVDYQFNILVKVVNDTIKYQCQIDILGDLQAGNELGAFATTVYNYFHSRFESAELRVRYFRIVEW